MNRVLTVGVWIAMTALDALEGQHKPIADYLIDHGASPTRAAEVAEHIVTQSKKYNVDPALITAIVTVENPKLRTDARSSAGARGVMQVMPFWGPKFRAQCGSNMAQDETNVCLGITVLKLNIAEHKQSLEHALRAYNGCTGTRPKCLTYSRVVLVRYRQLAARIAKTESP